MSIHRTVFLAMLPDPGPAGETGVIRSAAFGPAGVSI